MDGTMASGAAVAWLYVPGRGSSKYMPKYIVPLRLYSEGMVLGDRPYRLPGLGPPFSVYPHSPHSPPSSPSPGRHHVRRTRTRLLFTQVPRTCYVEVSCIYAINDAIQALLVLRFLKVLEKAVKMKREILNRRSFELRIYSSRLFRVSIVPKSAPVLRLYGKQTFLGAAV